MHKDRKKGEVSPSLQPRHTSLRAVGEAIHAGASASLSPKGSALKNPISNGHSPNCLPGRRAGTSSPIREPKALRLCLHRTQTWFSNAAHGSRGELVSLTWPRPLADECSLNDTPSSALGLHSPSLYLCLGIKRASLCQDSLRVKSGDA